MKKLAILTLCAAAMCGCWKDDGTDPKDPVFFTENRGVVTYTGYEPLADKPVNVYYNIPPGGNRATMPILFVLHGTNRTASNYRDAWVAASNSKKFMVFALEFSSTYYSGSKAYNQGGMYTAGDVLKPEREWTFSIIEPLFDFIVKDLSSTHGTYDMWGHSAGAQFTHRYVLFKPYARINRAVSANAGWYCLPDFTVDYPYGLKNSPATEVSRGKSFADILYIQAGTADIDPNDPDLDHSPGAEAQGPTRYARAQYFWNNANQNKAGYSAFNWQMREVQGVAHEYKKMAEDAAKFLY